MHTDTYAKTFLPSPASCQDIFKHTHRHRISYIAPLLHPPPHPAHPVQSSHPLGLCVRMRLWTQQPLISNPPLWVLREMKALGVHYKTTTAAAGDRPPGATNYAFSSSRPQLLLSVPQYLISCSLYSLPQTPVSDPFFYRFKENVFFL